jgi:hypothetical protein
MRMILFGIFASLLATQTDRPAYIVRGNQIEEIYQRYIAELNVFHETLVQEVWRSFPNLEEDLEEKPKAVPYGYQVLPKIIADSPRPDKPSPLVSTSYSWLRTQRLIESEQAKIHSNGERSISERVAGYRELVANQKLIDQHVQYLAVAKGHRGRQASL